MSTVLELASAEQGTQPQTLLPRSVPQGPNEYQRLVYLVEQVRQAITPASATTGCVVQFVAPSSGDGTTTIASQFARAAAFAYAHPIYYVDCATLAGSDRKPRPLFGRKDSVRRRPPITRGLLEAFSTGDRLQTVCHPASGCENLFWSSLSSRTVPSLVGEHGDLMRDLLVHMRYLTAGPIVLDTPSIEETPLSAVLAGVCDQTILVIKAGVTHSAAARRATITIQQSGGRIGGSVINQQRRQLSAWLRRWV